MTHSPKNRINAGIFMKTEISRILPNSFAIAWGNSGSHDFSSNTNYQLLCTERTLYNNNDIFETNKHDFKPICKITNNLLF